MQVMFVIRAELPFSQQPVLPALDLWHHERQDPQPVVCRHNRHAKHVAEDS